jgi:hypothetical protein
MRLTGLLLLLAVLVVGFRQLTTPTSAPVPAPVIVPAPAAPPAHEIAAQPVVNEPVRQEPAAPAAAPTGGCRVVADGYLETSPIIGAPDAQFVHGVYWFPGQPEYNVLLEGSEWQRPAGAGGRFWAYGGGGCTRDFVAAQIAGHIERTTLQGVNTGGMGDPSLFARVR